MRGEAADRLSGGGDGVAPVGLVEVLRVGSAMLCPSALMSSLVGGI